MKTHSEACSLSEKKCKPCEGGTAPIKEDNARELLKNLAGWALCEGGIEKEFKLKDHYQTLSFVNAVAWISHAEDHHPSVEFGYNTLKITYITHAIGGLSENDFICASKVDRL